jgi:uncharacterized protein YcfJ
MKAKLLALSLAAALLVAPLACTPTQKGAAIGAGTGGAAGALIGGHHKRTRSAAIGAAAGGLIGGIVGHTYEINKFCPTCGRRFHRTKQFCPYDGTQLIQRQ